MSYNPVTDFIGLLRTTASGVRNARMPGLDFFVSALARIGFINLSVGPNAPTVNQAATVWLQPAVPSWSAEGAFFLWNPSLLVYQPATPALWTLLLQAALSPSNFLPLINGIAAAGVSLFYSRADHVHPTDVTRAPINSPLFTGNPQAPNPAPGDNSQSLATTEYVQASITGSAVPIPIGTVIPYAGLTAPTSNWVIPVGQLLNRVTFASLFAIVGTTFSAGDGVSTFGIPDMRGRVPAGVDNAVGRLTTATMSSQALGGVGGLETKSLITANLPPYTPAGSITNGAISASAATAGGGALSGGSAPSVALNANNALSITQGASTFGGIAQGGTSAAVGVVQPTIELTYLMRVN